MIIPLWKHITIQSQTGHHNFGFDIVGHLERNVFWIEPETQSALLRACCSWNRPWIAALRESLYLITSFTKTPLKWPPRKLSTFNVQAELSVSKKIWTGEVVNHRSVWVSGSTQGDVIRYCSGQGESARQQCCLSSNHLQVIATPMISIKGTWWGWYEIIYHIWSAPLCQPSHRKIKGPEKTNLVFQLVPHSIPLF